MIFFLLLVRWITLIFWMLNHLCISVLNSIYSWSRSFCKLLELVSKFFEKFYIYVNESDSLIIFLFKIVSVCQKSNLCLNWEVSSHFFNSSCLFLERFEYFSPKLLVSLWVKPSGLEVFTPRYFIFTTNSISLTHS
jgi:hypothetical protein